MMKKSIIAMLFLYLIITSCESDTKLAIEPTQNKPEELEQIISDSSAVYVKQKNLIEDYSATWCGNCILAVDKTEKADKQSFVPVVIHFLSSSLQNDQSVAVAQKNNIRSQTTIIINKKQNHSYRNPISEVSYPTKSQVAIKIDSKINGNQVLVTSSFRFYKDYNDLKYSIYVLENGVVASQANYHFDHLANPVDDFIHNHVLRKAVLDIEIPNSIAKKDSTFTQSQTVSISSLSVSALDLVVFVNSDQVLNAQSTAVGASVDFHNKLN